MAMAMMMMMLGHGSPEGSAGGDDQAVYEQTRRGDAGRESRCSIVTVQQRSMAQRLKTTEPGADASAEDEEGGCLSGRSGQTRHLVYCSFFFFFFLPVYMHSYLVGIVLCTSYIQYVVPYWDATDSSAVAPMLGGFRWEGSLAATSLAATRRAGGEQAGGSTGAVSGPSPPVPPPRRRRPDCARNGVAAVDQERGPGVAIAAALRCCCGCCGGDDNAMRWHPGCSSRRSW